MADSSPNAIAPVEADRDAVQNVNDRDGGEMADNDVTQRSDGSLDDKAHEDVPPDGGYGWVCVACAACINCNTWGVNSSYSVFLSYYLSHEIFPNMSDIAYAFTGGLSMSCCLLIAPIVTYMVSLFGNRVVLNIGVALQTISFIGASFASQQWHIFLSQGVCFGWGMGFLFIGSVGIAPQWFSRKRSVANSLCAAGSGIGGLTYSLATNTMLSRFGLGWTFRILGIVTFAANIVAVNLMRDRNKATGSRHRAFHFPLLKRPEFVLMQVWGLLSLLGYVVVLFSLADFARSIGLSAHQGSIVSALLNLGQALGRPVVGLSSDRFGRINVASVASLLCGLFCLVIWIPAQNMGVLCFFAIIVGTVAGTFWTTIAPVCAEVIGLQELPSGLSITWVLNVPPTTVAEPIAVLLKDSTRGNREYIFAQLFAGLVYAGGALCLWFVRAWKVGDNVVVERKKAAAAAARNSRPLKTVPQSAVEKERVTDAPENQAPIRTDEEHVTLPVDERIWSPTRLCRSMVAWTRV